MTRIARIIFKSIFLFAYAATQTDVSDFNVTDRENATRELNETVEKLSRQLSSSNVNSNNTNLMMKNARIAPKILHFTPALRIKKLFYYAILLKLQRKP